MYQDIRNRKIEVYDGKVRPVFEELIEYGYGYKALANALNERGILSAKGKRWTSDAVKHALTRLGLKTLGEIHNAL